MLIRVLLRFYPICTVNTGPYFVWKRFSPTELSYFSIPFGGSPDLFGQETQSECSLEAMTEAYEGLKKVTFFHNLRTKTVRQNTTSPLLHLVSARLTQHKDLDVHTTTYSALPRMRGQSVEEMSKPIQTLHCYVLKSFVAMHLQVSSPAPNSNWNHGLILLWSRLLTATPLEFCSIRSDGAGAINIVGLGKPVEADMEKPLPCFKGHSPRTGIYLHDVVDCRIHEDDNILFEKIMSF